MSLRHLVYLLDEASPEAEECKECLYIRGGIIEAFKSIGLALVVSGA
jgi:hypothetical protein